MEKEQKEKGKVEMFHWAIAIIAAAALTTSSVTAGGNAWSMHSRVCQKEQKSVQNPYEPGGIYENMKIVYKFGKSRVVLTSEDVVDWVRYWPDGHWDIDDAKIADYIENLQKHFDTCDKEKFFVTTGKKQLWLKGDYGWRLDREKEVKEISKLLRRNGTTIHPLHFLTEASERNRPYRDYGNSYVEIDLSRQVLWLYEEGKVTVRSDIVSGLMNTDRQTPSGIFCVKYKQSPAVLRGADYTSPVSFWMPFNGGIGLHDATWQPAFGGDLCYTKGSHGCINLPLEKAEKIYEKIEKGFPVICYYSNPEDEKDESI